MSKLSVTIDNEKIYIYHSPFFDEGGENWVSIIGGIPIPHSNICGCPDCVSTRYPETEKEVLRILKIIEMVKPKEVIYTSFRTFHNEMEDCLKRLAGEKHMFFTDELHNSAFEEEVDKIRKENQGLKVTWVDMRKAKAFSVITSGDDALLEGVKSFMEEMGFKRK
jgi:hypothetical protein